MVQFYNTLGRELQEFKPIHEGKASIYSCGPTVYNYVHIGNLRAMLVYDLVKKYLEYKGFEVTHVMNITDVDDKTINGAKEEKKSLKEFTDHYTKAFLEDLATIGIEIPKTMPKATDNIDPMIKMIETLLEKEVAYKTDNGIYFSIKKYSDYGKLALLQVENLKENAEGRLEDEYDKEDARDFALWKFRTEDDGDVGWEASFGKGRPGWHIECSAMAHEHLTEPFDIHMGGCDLIFPHHTNEIAQSECAFGGKFCNYWLHNEHLIVNGEKMSKSAGNFYTLRDLLEKGYHPIAIRYELLATHYRQQLDFTEEHLKNSPVQKFADFMRKLQEVEIDDEVQVVGLIEDAKKKFQEAMDMDLNISGGLAAIFDFMKEVNKLSLGKHDADLIRSFMEELDTVLGILKHEDDIPQEIYDLADARQNARSEKNFEESDRIRDELKEKGYVIEDKSEGFRVKKIL